MDSKLEKAQKLSSFWIKIIAFATMALDHIGAFMWQHVTSQSDALYIVGFIFRCIGRLSFPLFILLLVEGLIHSKSVGRYLLRRSARCACANSEASAAEGVLTGQGLADEQGVHLDRALIREH